MSCSADTSKYCATTRDQTALRRVLASRYAGRPNRPPLEFMISTTIQ
jgi:hypothetical protein